MKIHYHTLLVAVVGLALSSGLNAQTLYGWRVITPSHVGIFAMDPDTGAAVQIADTGVGYSASSATLDPIGKRYFIDGSSNILMIDLVRGATTTLYANGLDLLEFDPLTGLLYGMKSVFPSGNLVVFSLNPATGETARVADTGVMARSSGPIFDPFARLYVFAIYEPAGDKLLVVDVATGTTRKVSSVLGGLVFDPASRLVYGIRLTPASGTFGVFSLDLTSGATTFIADTGIPGTFGMLSDQTIDPIGRRYFISVNSFTNTLVVVNLVTGVVKHLDNPLYYQKFDSGSRGISIPALNLSFLATLATLLALVGLWRAAR